jgi:hypothetical protein
VVYRQLMTVGTFDNLGVALSADFYNTLYVDEGIRRQQCVLDCRLICFGTLDELAEKLAVVGRYG